MAVKPTAVSQAPDAPRRRLAPADRERQILDKAIEHFTQHGFAGSTRELARQLGITQPLLYRYFPSKQALIERVYAEVFRWEPQWQAGLTDRTVPLRERLLRFYGEYARVQLQASWTRILVFDGLAAGGLYGKYLRRMRSRVFEPVLAEVRHAFDIPAPRDAAMLDAEVELVWSLHAAIFYLGVRKWIFDQRIPRDLDAAIRQKVDAFLASTPVLMRASRGAPPS
ncbi:MAG: TetR/AcrR family transcriptional regulator [Betaproteobacteria bacterium]|nr:TetR/AcrR family transcriptional regulator [Betaproteobacteria bacterium]